MLSTNERDIIAILQFAIATKTPNDQAAAAMQRLLAQLPQPDEVDTRPDGEQRREFLEKMKAPANWTPPPPEKPDGERRKEFLEQMKRPLGRSAKAVT